MRRKRSTDLPNMSSYAASNSISYLSKYAIQLIGAEDFGYLDELIIVIVTVEEGFLAENLQPGMRRDLDLRNGEPWRQTCNQDSTCPNYNRILGNRQGALGP